MSLYELYNEVPVRKPSYKANSEVALYKLFKIINVAYQTTSISPTVRVNCLETPESEIYFYLNKEDFKKWTDRLHEGILRDVALHQNPYIFMAKLKSGLATFLVDPSK